eukprot:c23689_g1_i1 orf=468-1196(-)
MKSAWCIFLLQTIVLVTSLPIFVATTDFVVINDAENESGGQIFDAAVGTTVAQQILTDATQFIQDTFYGGDPSIPEKDVSSITLYVDDKSNPNPAYTVGADTMYEIHLSESYIASYTGDVAKEIEGILYHESTHAWQWNGQGQAPSGLIEGIADYIRLTANLAASTWGQPGEGSSWDEGYDVTAYFLQYCESLSSSFSFVEELNAKMATGWSETFFQDLLGQTVQQLWSSYKSKYSAPTPAS